MSYPGEDGLGCPRRTVERSVGRGVARVSGQRGRHVEGLEVRGAGAFEAKKAVVTKGKRGEAG